MPTSVTLTPQSSQLSGLVELTGTSHCVVYVHGFGSDVRGEKPQAVFAACARRGWSCAAFDFRGHGRSSGTMRDLRASGLQSDLAAIAEYLTGQDIKRLFLVGSSMGGFATSWFALNNPDLVTAVALIAPAFRFLRQRWEDLSEQDRRAWRDNGVMRFRNQWLDVELDFGLVAQDERKAFDPDRLADGWRTPALIFHGLRDETVPWQDTLALLQRTKYAGWELRLLGDGDHRLTAYRDEIAEEACRFFARWGEGSEPRTR